MSSKKSFAAIIFWLFYFTLFSQQNNFNLLCTDFIKGYTALNIPEMGLDYKVNFKNIQSADSLKKQELFFSVFKLKLDSFDLKTAKSTEIFLRHKQLKYEVAMNLERISLEKKWNAGGRKIPDGGLHSMPDFKNWYSYLVKYFTSVNISPEKVHAYGKSEVEKIKKQILFVQQQLGFKDEKIFYESLKRDTFFLTDKKDILKAYAKIDSTVRKNMGKLFSGFGIPEIGVIEWPDATAQTPPGMYLDKEKNDYGKDVFLYNFYGGRHNVRAMDWLYMHEGIPGHHLQSVFKNIPRGDSLQNVFFYFGNAEGWACYVEELGEQMGLYKNKYLYLGKLQWDLVRSARLVMETGIHYYGWSMELAMNYWKENIKGQDEIALREITRITNWPGQALCYKIGAMAIQKVLLRKKNLAEGYTYFLKHSDFPLEILLSQHN